MTEEFENKSRSLVSRLSMWIFICMSVFLVVYTNEAKEGFALGLKLSALSVIPAIFPFFILSDFLFCFYNGNNGIAEKLFERVFKIDSSGFKAYIIGVLCGFPLGTKCTAELYARGEITKSECERLSAISSSPSFAFVVSGIGLGIYGSLKIGIILYFSVVTAGILVGILLRTNKVKSAKTPFKSEQTYDFACSVKKAGLSSLSIASNIIFFSIIINLLSAAIKNDFFIALLTALLEIGNAALKISEFKGFTYILRLSLTAFALGFSGICVFFQGAEYLPKEVSKRNILLIKLLQGVISFFIASALKYPPV